MDTNPDHFTPLVLRMLGNDLKGILSRKHKWNIKVSRPLPIYLFLISCSFKINQILQHILYNRKTIY